MQRFNVIIVHLLYLSLVHVHQSSSIIDKFVYTENNIKCCKPGNILTNNNVTANGTYECVHYLNPTSILEAREILSDDLLGKSRCIDMIKDGKNEDVTKIIEINGSNVTYSDVRYFPKCCPLYSAYDPQKHRCVSVNNTNDITAQVEALKNSVNNTLLHIKYGLGDCQIVISDYELSSVNFTEELGLQVTQLNQTINYGNYCVDNIYNKDTYVVRVCHNDFGVCRRRKTSTDEFLCVRKCCPDGKSYKLGPKCVPDYENGFAPYFASGLSDSYAVIPGISCRKYLSNTIDYVLNEAGSVRIMPEDNPTLLLSPFRHTYCFEYAKTDFSNAFHLFLCFLSPPKTYS